MDEPLAATNLEVLAKRRSADVAGKTLSSAPESIRKERLENTSKMEIEEGGEGEKGLPAAVTSDRPFRFPEPEQDASVPGGALDSAEIYRRKPCCHIAGV